ncbi:Rrf2 family transcriptional regulator [bacterium]|nr:Rrf2 family transcriptional regulator [candidate division CSSED10-310 bacterium]
MAIKITSKVRYGLRAMVELGISYPDGPTLMNTIAHQQNIPAKYLHTILSSLRNANLIRSIRGASGGFELLKNPDEIRLWEIVKALDGTLALCDCIEDDTMCERSSFCIIRDVWLDLNQIMENRLNEISLGELILLEKKKRANAFMYYI